MNGASFVACTLTSLRAENGSRNVSLLVSRRARLWLIHKSASRLLSRLTQTSCRSTTEKLGSSRFEMPAFYDLQLHRRNLRFALCMITFLVVCAVIIDRSQLISSSSIRRNRHKSFLGFRAIKLKINFKKVEIDKRERTKWNTTRICDGCKIIEFYVAFWVLFSECSAGAHELTLTSCFFSFSFSLFSTNRDIRWSLKLNSHTQNPPRKEAATLRPNYSLNCLELIIARSL